MSFLGLDQMDEIHKWEINSHLPLWIWLLISFAVAGSVFFFYLKEKELPLKNRITLALLRSIFVALLILIFFDPTIQVNGEATVRGNIPVIVDITESMGVSDMSEKQRIEVAKEMQSLLKDNLSTIDGIEAPVYWYGEGLENLESKPDKLSGMKTSVNQMLKDVMKAHRGEPLPGIVLLSDGAQNSGESIRSVLPAINRRNIPIYPVPMGLPVANDIQAQDLFGESIIFAGEKFKFWGVIDQYGYDELEVTPKVKFGGLPIQQKPVTFTKTTGNVVEIEFKADKAGVYDLELEIPAEPGELTDSNNIIKKRIQVIDDKLRVLFVFGSPTWEFRYLIGNFMRDRRVTPKVYLKDVDKRLIERKTEPYIQSLPEDQEELNKNYDLVILGDINLHELPEEFLEYLVEFVSADGGGVVFSSDGRYMPYSVKGTPLEELLPVKLLQYQGPVSYRQEVTQSFSTPQRMTLTEDGITSPLLRFHADPIENKKAWDSFPDFYEPIPKVQVKPAARVLVESKVRNDDLPIFVFQNFGKGTSMYMGVNSTWRWRKEYGNRYFNDYWGKLVQFMGLPHMLGTSAQSYIQPGGLKIRLGETMPVKIIARNKDFSPVVRPELELLITLKDVDDGNVERVKVPGVKDQPGVYQFDYYPKNEGKFILALDDRYSADVKEFEVVLENLELLDAGMNRKLLDELAVSTNGQNFELRASEDSSAANEELIKIVNNGSGMHWKDASFLSRYTEWIVEQINSKRRSSEMQAELRIWTFWPLFILLMILMTLEYSLRRIWFLD
ncbi:MAG: hypothetical protein MK193_04360 [Lentisphaeria bacterium]|nr:hypothetical protein [Lentisphaeria bacterium]